MTKAKIVQFPMRNPDLFSREINCQVLKNSEFSRVLAAAIQALPHISDCCLRQALNEALCDLLLRQNGAA